MSEWVTIRQFDSLVQLDRAVLALDRVKLESRKRDDHTLQSDPAFSLVIGGARLEVRAEDEAAAREVMAELFGVPDEALVADIDRKVKSRLALALGASVLVAVVGWLVTGDPEAGLGVAAVAMLCGFIMAFMES